MEKYSVDRIEGAFAVLVSNGKTSQISLDKLPESVKDGCVLVKDDSGMYFIDNAQTEKIKTALNELQNSLFDE